MAFVDYLASGQAGEVERLVMILRPLLSPQHYLLQVALQIFRRVAPEHVDDFLTVRLHSLLVDHLEDFTLHVVLQLFPRVPPDGAGKKTTTTTQLLITQIRQRYRTKTGTYLLSNRVYRWLLCVRRTNTISNQRWGKKSHPW